MMHWGLGTPLSPRWKRLCCCSAPDSGARECEGQYMGMGANEKASLWGFLEKADVKYVCIRHQFEAVWAIFFYLMFTISKRRWGFFAVYSDG